MAWIILFCTWDHMLTFSPDKHVKVWGRRYLVWSLVQLRLSNQSKVLLIGRLTQVPVEIDGIQSYAYTLKVLYIVDDTNLYPTLLELTGLLKIKPL